jgi:peptide/nickel transport system permease protein
VTIAFGATAIAATMGTTLGFLAAHFRGAVEQVVLMLIDFQASMPFLIIALSPCWRSSATRCRCSSRLMGFYGLGNATRGWPAAWLSQRTRQGYAAAVRQSAGSAAVDLLGPYPAEYRGHADCRGDAVVP